MAKGLGIILVVFAHTSLPAVLKEYIYTFHIPMLFFVSGYLLFPSKYPTDKIFLLKKFKSIVVPYFSFSAICYLFWLFIRHFQLIPAWGLINKLTPLWGTFLAVRNTNFMIHNEALWFLGSLFLAEVIFYLSFKYLKLNDLNKMVSFLFTIAVLGSLYNKYINIVLPWALDTVFVSTTFFGLGFLAREMKVFSVEKVTKVKTLVVFLVINLLAEFTNNILFLSKSPIKRVDIFYRIYGNSLLYYLSAIAGIIFFVSLIYKLKHSKILSYFGKNSLTVFALHQAIVIPLISIILTKTIYRPDIFPIEGSLNLLFNGISYTLLIFALMVPAVFLINNYAPFVLGKPSKQTIEAQKPKEALEV